MCTYSVIFNIQHYNLTWGLLYLNFLLIHSDTITGHWLLLLFSVCRSFRKRCPRFYFNFHYVKDLKVQKPIRSLILHITRVVCDAGSRGCLGETENAKEDQPLVVLEEEQCIAGISILICKQYFVSLCILKKYVSYFQSETKQPVCNRLSENLHHCHDSADPQ